MEEQHSASIKFPDLPIEVLLHLLSFADIKTLAVLRLISHQYKLLAEDERLWKRLSERILLNPSLSINPPISWRQSFQTSFTSFFHPPARSPNNSPPRAINRLASPIVDPIQKKLIFAALAKDSYYTKNISSWRITHLRALSANGFSAIKIALRNDDQLMLNAFYAGCDQSSLSEAEKQELMICCRQYTVESFSTVYQQNCNIFNYVINYGIVEYLPALTDADLSRHTNIIFTGIILGHWDFVDALLARGVSIDAKALSGDTPLAEAVISRRLTDVKELLKRSADPHIKNNNNESPAELAEKLANASPQDAVKQEIAELLNSPSSNNAHKRKREEETSEVINVEDSNKRLRRW